MWGKVLERNISPRRSLSGPDKLFLTFLFFSKFLDMENGSLALLLLAVAVRGLNAPALTPLFWLKLLMIT